MIDPRNKKLKHASPAESAFLGIGVGKKAKAEAEAAIKRIEAETAAKLKLTEADQQKLLLQLEAAKQGYDPAKTEAEKTLQVEKAKAQPERTLYLIIGVIVVAVMAGLYFIKKR